MCIWLFLFFNRILLLKKKSTYSYKQSLKGGWLHDMKLKEKAQVRENSAKNQLKQERKCV